MKESDESICNHFTNYNCSRRIEHVFFVVNRSARRSLSLNQYVPCLLNFFCSCSPCAPFNCSTWSTGKTSVPNMLPPDQKRKRDSVEWEPIWMNIPSMRLKRGQSSEQKEMCLAQRKSL